MRFFAILLFAGAGFGYLLNPFADPLPDNVPVIGMCDDYLAVTIGNMVAGWLFRNRKRSGK